MRITARLIGSVEIRDADGSELDTLPSQPKRFGLLSYLLTAQPRGFHRRDKLVGLFWPEASQDQARHSLSQALHVLRGELGEGTIRSRGDGDVAIDEATISCDAVEFELKSSRGRRARGTNTNHQSLTANLREPIRSSRGARFPPVVPGPSHVRTIVWVVTTTT